MGLAASQARALLLVARKSDLEYRSQCISQRKMVLAQQTEQIAKDYSNKISNRKLLFAFNLDASSSETIGEDFTYSSLCAQNPGFVGQYRITNSRGDVIVSSYNEIPKTEKYAPVYTLVKNGDIQYSSEPIYTQTTDAQLKEKVELYAKSFDESGKETYVKVQNVDGTKIDDAKINVLGTAADGSASYSSNSVFTKTGDNYSLNDGVTLFTKTTSTSPITSTTNDASAYGDGYSFVQTGYKKVYEDPVQQSDGYYSADGKKYIVCPDINSTNYFQNGLRTGAFLLQQATTVEVKDTNGTPVGEQTTWETIPWQGSSVTQDVLDTSDDGKAESEYESKLAVIKCQDQKLDMELKQIETQHKAAETELDAIKDVINKNIEKTFKIFA